MDPERERKRQRQRDRDRDIDRSNDIKREKGEGENEGARRIRSKPDKHSNIREPVETQGTQGNQQRPLFGPKMALNSPLLHQESVRVVRLPFIVRNHCQLSSCTVVGSRSQFWNEKWFWPYETCLLPISSY